MQPKYQSQLCIVSAQDNLSSIYLPLLDSPTTNFFIPDMLGRVHRYSCSGMIISSVVPFWFWLRVPPMQPYTLFPWLVVKKCHSSSNPVIFVLHTYIGEIFILKCSTITEVLDMLYSWQQDFDV